MRREIRFAFAVLCLAVLPASAAMAGEPPAVPSRAVTFNPSAIGNPQVHDAVVKINRRFDNIAILPISGIVDYGLRYSIERRVAQARAAGAELILFDVDTPGGSLAAAMNITDFVGNLPDLPTVAYISRQALSAGAFFCIACDEIVMRKNTTIGDCQPIIPVPNKAPVTPGEKIESPLRADFRKYAEDNGYPSLLCEAMVTAGMEVYRVEWKDGGGEYVDGRDLDKWPEEKMDKVREKSVIVRKGELLTMTDSQALALRFSRQTVPSREAATAVYLAEGGVVVEYPVSGAEHVVRLLNHPAVTGFLMLVGMIALYMALKMPGLGLPEGLALICFGIIFFSKYTVHVAEAWEIAVVIVGLALIFVELFVLPGFGVCGIAGMIVFGLGMVLVLQDFSLPRRPYQFDMMLRNIVTILAAITGSVIGFLFLARLAPGTPGLNRIVLKGSEKAEAGYTVARPRQQQLAGREGTALTTLRPAGRAEIDDRIVDVVTEGNYLEKGDRIRVVKVEGNRVIVARV